jgi:hypothetical protein
MAAVVADAHAFTRGRTVCSYSVPCRLLACVRLCAAGGLAGARTIPAAWGLVRVLRCVPSCTLRDSRRPVSGSGVACRSFFSTGAYDLWRGDAQARPPLKAPGAVDRRRARVLESTKEYPSCI